MLFPSEVSKVLSLDFGVVAQLWRNEPTLPGIVDFHKYLT